MKRSLIVVLLLAVALPLAAQMGRMPGMRGSGDNSAMMSGITVGSDGTAYVVRRVSGSTGSFELAAIRPSGTVAWTFALPANQVATAIATNGTTVFVSLFGTSGTFPNLSLKSSLVGLSVSSGAPFTIGLEGIAIEIETYSDGAYVLETAINPAGMMTTIGRKLMSVSNSGKVNFTLPLD